MKELTARYRALVNLKVPLFEAKMKEEKELSRQIFNLMFLCANQIIATERFLIGEEGELATMCIVELTDAKKILGWQA